MLIGAWSRVARGVGGPTARYARAADWKAPERQIKSLNDRARELLAGFESGRSVGQICRDVNWLNDFEACQLIWALKVVGVLEQLPDKRS